MHNYNHVINALLVCARACEHCSSSCLKVTDVHNLVNCIRHNRECADVCILTSRLLERDSIVTDEMIDVCIKISRICAEECEKFTQFDFCKQCADACRKVEKTTADCL